MEVRLVALPTRLFHATMVLVRFIAWRKTGVRGANALSLAELALSSALAV
jgi:hypothetical protein